MSDTHFDEDPAFIEWLTSYYGCEQNWSSEPTTHLQALHDAFCENRPSNAKELIENDPVLTFAKFIFDHNSGDLGQTFQRTLANYIQSHFDGPEDTARALTYVCGRAVDWQERDGCIQLISRDREPLLTFTYREIPNTHLDDVKRH